MITRYLSTLRYLKPVQICYRPIFFSKRTLVRVCDQGALEELAARARTLRSQRGAAVPIVNWFDGAQEKLHRYHLNAFELSKLYGFDVLGVRLDWIAQNTDELAESWEPYVISRRVVNWLRLLDGEGDDEHLIAESIFWQIKRLSVDVEYHLQANHLFENFKALFVGSLYLLHHTTTSSPGIGESRISMVTKWLTRGLVGLHAQLIEQILDDGAHYERSPMYHAVITDGVRDIVWSMERWGRAAPHSPHVRTHWSMVQQRCESILPKMEAWLSCFTHPDGNIALFHDSAFDGVPSRESHLPAPRDGAMLLEPSGFFVRRWGHGDYFAMDCGEPSPRHQPAHAHCSILSYELSLSGHRVVVDSGCGSYQHPEVRRYCRSTAAHNVPMIEGMEQSEIWGAFRLGRRATVCVRLYDRTNDRVECRVQDFRGNVMTRRVTFTSDTIRIDDVLEQRARPGTFASRIHLAPGASTDRIQISGPCAVHAASYYPEFGRRVGNRVIHCLGNPADTNRITYHIRYGS